MMKKMTFLIVMLFAMLTCTAPEITEDLRQKNGDKALAEISRIETEKKQAEEFQRFVDQLRAKESPDWTKVNEIGCMGWFQFHPATLASMGYGYITVKSFKADPYIFPPEMQLRLLEELIKANEHTLRNYMSYIGTEINGIVITKAGLIAGAHLGGAGGVIKYLRSEGRSNPKDMNNTSIQDYISHFQGYNM